MTVRAVVREEFTRRYGAPPAHIARAPGRVNLIGEHTDYNDGFVLPMAIDREVCVAFRPRKDKLVVVHSLEYDETVEFDLTAIIQAEHTWIEYLKGVAWALGEQGARLTGWEGVLSGDVPRGAGLSSSAALELATMRTFAALNHSEWLPAEAAILGQRVENKWIGVNSGIMDQMVVASAQENHALLLDCRSLGTRHVPIPNGIAVVVLDTATRRGLVDSQYNERRRQCEEAAAFFAVEALRDVTTDQLEQGRRDLDEMTYRRAHHVVTENTRTVAAADALRAGDMRKLGELMNASHASLRDDFEVTNRELDTIVEIAQADDACHGARMTGAGFGGCAVAVVEREAAVRFIESVTTGYQSRTGLQPSAYICRAAGGASLETEPSTESVRS